MIYHLTNHIKEFKPRYLRMSDKMFKQMLSNEIEHDDNTIQCLDTKEKIEFVRQMTEATNNLYYFDLQRQLWQAYDDIGMKEGVWMFRVSKSFAKQHHTCRSYGFAKHIIDKRQNKINQQFKQAIDRVQQYIIELEQNVQQWQPSIHPAILSNAINECVKNAQRRLRQTFDYKKKMLTFNYNDHHWIKQFYHLQPSQEQVLWKRYFEYSLIHLKLSLLISDTTSKSNMANNRQFLKSERTRSSTSSTYIFTTITSSI